MKRVIISIGLCFGFFSCNNLDLSPLSSGSSENWYSDETEVVLALNKLYHLDYWENYYYPNSLWLDQWVDSWSDDWTCRNDLSSFTGGTLNGQTDIIVKHWQNSYQCIQEANHIIKNISRSGLSQSLAKRYEAEARFVRASQYAKLVFHFGDIPFYEGSLEIDEALAMQRTPKDEVLRKIYADYDFAVEYLPLSYGATELQRATKGAALALKSRIALYMGDFALARDAAQECISLNQYQLYPAFSELFGQKNSIETIFAIPRSVELNSFRNIEQIVNRNTGGFATVQPSWDLLFSFLCTDGLRVDESPLFDPREPFKNRDPRCAATIVPFGSLHLGVIYQPHPDTMRVWNQNLGVFQNNTDNRSIGLYASFNGLVWKKWLKQGWYSGNRGDMDNIVIRYADVLLMYAEAKIELGEIHNSVLNAINSVRSRAYQVDIEDSSKYPKVLETNQDALRQLIRIERRMELAFEGRRYADIIRWRLAEKALNVPIYGMLDPEQLREKVVNKDLWFFPYPPKLDPDGISDFSELYNDGYIKLLALRKFDKERHYLWPIPTKEILINSNLSQNIGY